MPDVINLRLEIYMPQVTDAILNEHAGQRVLHPGNAPFGRVLTQYNCIADPPTIA
jgi:hypothetical protein